MKAEFPDKLHDLLFSTARYRVAYGGRGASKSWNFARALLLQGVEKPLRILCARETQQSIGESVHRLLSDQIATLGLDRFYTIEKARILGTNGTEITFAGLRHNVANIKSYEGADIVWVEEAQSVTRESWNTLIPTIRKENSSIWVSFNPDFDDDPTYKMFVANQPPDSIVMKINWRDNPWFPDVLRREKNHMKATDPDEYEHVWEGSCISLLQSAIYANELRAVEREDRICSVPYDRSRPVDCYWDLGYGDLTAVWFAQSFPFQYRLIDYIEDCAKPLQWYLQQMQARGYLYGNDWLPWDVGMHATQLGSGRSIEELLRLAGRKVRIVPKLSVADGIAAARTVFPVCWFDRERTELGVRALRHYRYGEVKAHHHPTREPLHDQASHGCLTADAFVLTENGYKRIDQVTTADRVWTPSGYADLLASGPTKLATELIRITLHDGNTLECTPDHKVFTKRGLVKAEALRTSDRVLSGNEWNSYLASLCSKAANIGFRATITGDITGVNQGHPIFTEPFGSQLTGQSQKVVRFITGTVTGLTTTFPTWSVSTCTSTSAIIPWNVGPQGSLKIPVSIAESEPRSGMLPQRGTSGTSNMARTDGKIASGWRSFVSSAASHFARLILRAPNSATRIAKLARYVPVEGSQWVYDLTCEKHACYQANGILVSNSDAFRYFAIGAKPPKPQMPPASIQRRGPSEYVGAWS